MPQSYYLVRSRLYPYRLKFLRSTELLTSLAGTGAAPPVGTAPTITSASSFSATSGSDSFFACTATGTAPITWALSGAPAGITIDSVTGVITVSALTAIGSYSFQVLATNVLGGTSQNFTASVSSVIVTKYIRWGNFTGGSDGHGTSFGLVPTAADVLAFTGSDGTRTDILRSYNFPANTDPNNLVYKYFWIDDGLGNPAADPSGFRLGSFKFVMASSSPYSSVINGWGYAPLTVSGRSGKVFRSANLLNGALTVTII